MAGKMRIHQPGDLDYVQQAFAFGAPEGKIRNKFPKVHYNLEGFRHVLNTYQPDFPSVGYDLEFNDVRPTIIGISNLYEAASLDWNPDLAREVVDVVQRRSGTLVAYSAFGADKPVTDKAIGRSTPISLFDDAMEAFYLLHQALAKSGDRSEEEEDMGSLGFFGLWTMSSFYTPFPQHKVCRGVDCPAAQGEDFPCPRHNVKGYNGIDAIVGAVGFYNMRKEFERRGIPWSLYKERLKLSYICNAMEERGVAHDADYIAKLEAKAQDYKAKLFPHTTDARGNPNYTLFNPNAPDQVVSYFRSQGVMLPDATKKSVLAALEERLKKVGILVPVKELDAYGGKIDSLTQTLWDCFSFKQTGKGTGAWFDKKYFRSDGFLHPRFVTTGAQTTRLSSSKPNFTNVPARGWGALVRGGIVPRNRQDERWVKADLSQLELRCCLWSAGVDVSTIKGDAFMWLVENSNGQLTKAAEIMQADERQAAKSVSHGADYLEGFMLLSGTELESKRRQEEIRAGALVVCHPKYGKPLWEWRGKIVCFTGANLAERLFGNKEYANRAKANLIQESYFGGFPQIREWQQRSLASIENSNYVRYPSGHQLEVIGPDVDVAKAAIAGLGQGGGAVLVMGIVVRNWEETGDLPELLVHDEVNFTRPRSWSDEKILESYRFMSSSRDDLMPGFRAPASVYRGETWLPEEDSKRPYPPELKAICLEKIGKV